MKAEDEASGSSLFAHPEAKAVFESVMTTLVTESDRGAVLVGTSLVDRQLAKLFEKVAPASLSHGKLKNMLSYPGVLSTLAAKADIAYTVRLIGNPVYKAIGILRSIRNEVAHSPDSFQLTGHEQRLREMYALGPGVPGAVNQMALRIILHSAVRHVLESATNLEEELGKSYFKDPSEVLDYIAESPELTALLEERRPRFELGICVSIICALIVYHREQAARVLKGDELIAALIPADARNGSPQEEEIEKRSEEVAPNPVGEADG
jgi:hypothetical protein